MRKDTIHILLACAVATARRAHLHVLVCHLVLAHDGLQRADLRSLHSRSSVLVHQVGLALHLGEQLAQDALILLGEVQVLNDLRSKEKWLIQLRTPCMDPSEGAWLPPCVHLLQIGLQTRPLALDAISAPGHARSDEDQGLRSSEPSNRVPDVSGARQHIC